MDEDIFPEYCVSNAIKTYKTAHKKLIRSRPKLENTKKTFEPIEKMNEAIIKREPLTTKTAVEYLLDGKLKSTVCRYCLNISPGLSELDQIMQIAGTGSLYKVTIREMIACFYPFKASNDQNLPEKICQQCLDKAINAYLFTQQCEQAERALHNCFDDIYEKLAKLDPIDRPKKRGRQKLNPNYNVLYAEHEKVIDYAEPIRNIINKEAESLSKEPEWNEFECKKCWQVLPNMESLMNHEKMHPKYMWYHCRLCGKSFPKHNQLKKHHTKIHILGKADHSEVDQNFKCKECGHVTENYIQHLQHIEKHKFKSIMDHVITKKTDRLCMICLNKSTDLVGLDNMVCIHGGYPELVGDKTLYTVLASTLPNQKSYKYQELHVPHKANIMTISKRKRKSNNIPGIQKTMTKININRNKQFVLSSPRVICNTVFKTNDFYYYVFCDPQIDSDFISCIDSNIDETMETESPRIIELNDDNELAVNMSDKIQSHEEKPANFKGSCNPDNKMQTDENIPNSNDLINSANYAQDKVLSNDKESIDMIKKMTDKKETIVIEDYSLEDKIITDTRNSTNLIGNCNKMTKKLHFDGMNPGGFQFSYPEWNVTNIKNMENVTKTHKTYNLNFDTGYTFNFSKPDYDVKSSVQEILDNKLIKERINDGWIFSKTTGNDHAMVNNKSNNIEKVSSDVVKKSDCKSCWLFKHLDKCEYCNKPIDKSDRYTNKNLQDIEKDIVDNINKNIETSIDKNIDTDTDINIKTREKEKNIDKIWQCSVCLTNNNTDRSACSCCETKKYYENGSLKITFGNKTFFETQQGDNNEDVKTDKVIFLPAVRTEDATVMDFKIGNSQDNIESQTMDTKDVTTTQNMDIIETDTVLNYVSNISNNKNDEQMDIEEIPFLPDCAMAKTGLFTDNNQNVDATPNFSNINQNLNTPTSSYSSTPIAPYLGTNFQFNIGSSGVIHGKEAKKTRRPLRNIPKAFHK